MATVSWGSNFSDNSSTYSLQIEAAYSSRVVWLRMVSDNGAVRNFTFTFGFKFWWQDISNFYTINDVGYYYCELNDSTGGLQYSNTVELPAYCMLKCSELKLLL